MTIAPLRIGRVMAVRVMAPVIVLALAVAFPDRLVNILEAVIELEFVHVAIHLFSTRYERLAAFLVYLTLCVVLLAIGRRPQRAQASSVRDVVASVVAATVAGVVLASIGRQYAVLIALGLLAVLLGNAQTSWVSARGHIGRAAVNVFFFVLVGVELLFPRPFLQWVRRRREDDYHGPDRSSRVWSAMPGSVVASAVFALLLPFESLAAFGASRWTDRHVDRLAGGLSFDGASPVALAWVAFDPHLKRLYVCGDGTDVLRFMDTSEAEPRLRRTGIPTGGAQFCGFIPERGEVLVFEREKGLLSWVSGDTMDVVRRMNIGRISDQREEVFIGYDPVDDAVFLTGEADHGGLQLGAIVDATTGQVRRRFGHGAGWIGNIAMHPGGRFVYNGFFTGPTQIVKFDVTRGVVEKQVDIGSRVDRLRVDGDREELLATLPVRGQIEIRDANTLARKGVMSTVRGARGLEIDRRRHLLLVASILSNELDIIDLNTRASIKTFRLGPWLRDIAIDEAAGLAYVTSRFGLYRVHYADSVTPQ